jgi:hypothetical protein
LQKLSTTGTVLGSTEFYLPKDETPGASEAAYEVFAGAVGLAVDDSTGKIYTVIYAAALKTCKKDKSKSKRVTCEKQAKKVRHARRKGHGSKK